MIPPDQDDDVPPLDPVKVTLFVLLLCAIGFAGWRFLRAQAAVAAVAEASKDYRKLFPARSSGLPEEPPAVKPAAAPASGMLLKIDDDMRIQKPAAVEAEQAPSPPAEEPPVAAAATALTAAAAVSTAPAGRTFTAPKLSATGSTRLNGGAGIRPKSDAKK